MNDLSGRTIKGYALLERIGAGGFGAVYRAHQSTVGREVAVKIILPRFANQPDFIRRFETEAQLVARLEHLHIVPLYDYWRDPSGAYLVMRWLRGGSLADAISQGLFDLGPAALLLDQIAAGLSLAHRVGIIHRDLKPSNILLDEDGNAYLSDFGIAKDIHLPDGEGKAIIGSPDYLSPEQARGDPVTAQSDIYSLGITLYELLTGRHPFTRVSAVELLFKQINDPIPFIEDLKPGSDEAINAVIQKATAKDPRQRYKDVLEMAASFRQAAGLSSVQPGTGLVESLTRREQEILQLIMDGRTNREIAQLLFVEVSTVKWYITQIYRKLGVRSRMQAIVRARELDLVVSLVEAESEPGQPTSVILPELTNPYKGLRAFRTADSADFFGREALTDRLVKRLGEKGKGSRFLAVVGPSGCGKSSLVKAGLIPSLWRGVLPGSERWFIVEMVPGARPLDELEIALMRVAADQAPNLRQHLDRDRNGLVRAAGLILPKDGNELILIVDQFEEIFTLVEDENERRHYIDLLCAAVEDPRSRVRVIITLRADYYGRPLAYACLGELIRTRMETVLPLSAEEVERAIICPAERVGIRFEAGLVPTIIEDVYYQPGALPLLQYALTELFEQRQDHCLTREAYQAIGGTAGALSDRAEVLYQEQDEAGREAVRQLFLRLVAMDGESDEAASLPDTRRRVSRRELLDISSNEELMDELIDTYAAYRLLTLDHDPKTRQPTVEIAHEAVLRAWDRLREWLEEFQQDLYQHRRLRSLVQEWLQNEQDASFLLRGTQLDQFAAWMGTTALALTHEEQSFLEHSQLDRQNRRQAEETRRQREIETLRQLAETEKQRAAEQSQTNRRLRWLIGSLVLAFTLAVAAAGLALGLANRSNQETHLAKSRELAAAAVNAAKFDPQLGILLALESVDEAQSNNLPVPREAVESVHQTLQANRIELVFNHPVETLWGMAYNPDGSRIVTTGSDGFARLWDVKTGKEVLALEHPEPVMATAFSPDGKSLATGTTSGLIHIWDSESGNLLRTLAGHTAGIHQLAYNHEGTRLASASSDTTARIWDVTNGQSLQTLAGHYQDVIGVAFSPDGSQVATTAILGIGRTWDVNTGDEILLLAEGNYTLFQPAFSPDGTRLATTTASGQVLIWDAQTGELLLTFQEHDAATYGLAFCPDGSCVATASEDNQIKVWDPQTGRVLRSFLAPHLDPTSLAFSPDGNHLLTLGMDGTATVWNLSYSQEWLTIRTPGGTGRLAFSPDGQHLAAGFGSQGGAAVWDVSTGLQIFALDQDGHTAAVAGAAYSPDGQLLATSSDDGEIKIWDSEKGQLQDTLSIDFGTINDIVFLDNTRLVSTGTSASEVNIWDLSSGSMRNLGFSAYGTWAIDIHPNGMQLASSTAQGLVKIISLQDANDESLVGHTGFVEDVDYSPSGDYLASAGADHLAIIWSADSGEILHILTGHSAPVTGVTFSPDNRWLATVSVDGTARIWDVESGEELLVLTADPIESFSSVTFSPDGKFLVAGGEETIRIYLTGLDDLVRYARTQVYRELTTDECQKYLNPAVCPQSAPRSPAVQATMLSDRNKICLVGDSILNDPYTQSFVHGVDQVVDQYGWLGDVAPIVDYPDIIVATETFLQANCELIVYPNWSKANVAVDYIPIYPEQKFLLLDLVFDEPYDNTWSNWYAADQAAFQAGYLAAAMSQTGKVGTFGGVPFDSVTSLMTGFEEGIDYYNRVKQANVQLLGWKNAEQDGLFIGEFCCETEGRALTQQLIDAGADVIFPLGGAVVSFGAVDLIQDQKDVLFIGVDVDWAATFPDLANITLTSVEKHFDQTILLAAQAIDEGTFQGCVHIGTLESGEVGLSPFYEFEAAVPTQIKRELEEIRAGIIAGEIQTMP